MSAAGILQSLIEEKIDEQDEIIGFTVRVNQQAVIMLEEAAAVAGVTRGFLAARLLEDAAEDAYNSLPDDYYVQPSKGKKS